MNWDTIFLGAALGFVIAIVVGEFVRTPSYKKTLPEEIAELAAKDERDRIVELLEEEFYRWNELDGVRKAISLIKGKDK